ncbi:hypothetical protein O181_078084 [Austropuccinia psidii MF-1]|uniref:Uncharacterized protein n=1 Tax=Austropuccinia psidii MF-1 TaxID=1389203 RepID=A0A9Q3FG84_9BASI|nr:hypothetical protein [Austropuccinia psidii MF-1]
MPTLTHELPSAPLPNPLQPLTCLHSCTALKKWLHGCPHICPHPLLCFRIPTAYHSDAPAAPSRYGCDTTTSSLHSPLLMPPHHFCLPSLHSHIRSIG